MIQNKVIRRLFIVAMTLALVLVAFFSLGPKLEPRLFPAAVAEARGVHIFGNNLIFSIEGSRRRDCPIAAALMVWEYGDVREPAVMIPPPPPPVNPPFNPPAPGEAAVGDNVIVGPLVVELSPGLAIYPDTNLVLDIAFRCHPFWLVRHQFVIATPV